MRNRGMINSLQAGRGLAALAVVCFHAREAAHKLIVPMDDRLIPLAYGYLGVDFFFVLSGFIVYYVSQGRIDEPRWSQKYVESRLTRVYIPYLPVGIGIALVYTAIPKLRGVQYDWDWFGTLTLLPGGSSALGVAWTLQHEIVFYAIAISLLKSGRVVAGSLLWAAIIITLQFTSIRIIGFLPIDLEFIFGMAAASCFVTGRFQKNDVLILFGVAVCALFFVKGDRSQSMIFGLGLAPLVLVMVRAEANRKIKIGASAILVGNASYAIYLVHPPLISVIVRLLRGGGLWPALVGSIIVSVVIGIVYHLWFERPALGIARRLIGKRRPAPFAD